MDFFSLIRITIPLCTLASLDFSKFHELFYKLSDKKQSCKNCKNEKLIPEQKNKNKLKLRRCRDSRQNLGSSGLLRILWESSPREMPQAE